MSALDLVLDRLEDVQPSGSGFMARCPAHDDTKGSLSVTEGGDGKVLLNCFAGCKKEDIVRALGLEFKDLFAVQSRNGHDKSAGRTSTSWEIKGPGGEIQAIHHRRDKPDGDKQVWWTRPDGTKGLGGKKTADLPLYRSERLGECSENMPVVVCEGEKAADALASIYPATLGTVTGASGMPGDEALEVLQGRRIVLWADNDDPGKAHMRRIAEKLQGIASEVRIFEWADAPEKGADAADHPTVRRRNEGSDIEPDEYSELLAGLEAAPVWEPGFEGVPESLSLKGEDTRDTLRAVRFNEIPDPGPRSYLLDGLIPEGFPVVLHGDGGVAKSMLALSLGLAVASGGKWLGREVGDGGGVLYLDFELEAGEQRRRANQLARGLCLNGVPDSMLYMSALGYPIREALDAALAECKEHGVKLLILDSLGPALQGDAEAAKDVIGFYQKFMEPFRVAGVTVLIIDHQSRQQSSQSYQSKSAFGSVYKTNLARSVIQVEGIAHHKEQGRRIVRLRHKKHNFGPLADPFDIKLTFTEEMITLEEETVDPADLAEEHTLTAAERVEMALELGPAYPHEIAEITQLALKTVKNELTKLKKAGKVMPTGEKNGQAEQVSLVSLPYKDRDAKDTSDNGDLRRIVRDESSEDGDDADNGYGLLADVPL